MTQTHFAFRIDRWTDDGERIVEHVAGAEDFQIAMATYHAARKRWPKAAMTLRQGTRVTRAGRSGGCRSRWSWLRNHEAISAASLSPVRTCAHAQR